MATTKAKGRVRRKPATGVAPEEFQAVCIECNHRSAWFKGEDTAQKHLDDHLDTHNGTKRSTSRAKGANKDDDGDPNTSEAAEVPGGQNTGPRGDSADRAAGSTD